MSTKTGTSAAAVRSLIPARLDRLPWTRFHTRLIMALGTAWILGGLEITLAGAVAGVLTNSDTLHMSSTALGDGHIGRRVSAKDRPRTEGLEIGDGGEDR